MSAGPPMRAAVTQPPVVRVPATRCFPVSFARGAPLLLLAAFGGLHWSHMVAPAAPGSAWWGVGVALVVVAALRVAAGAQRAAARAATAAAVVVAAVGAALAAGFGTELLRPDRWGTLAAAVARGIDTVGGTQVPYGGLDVWARATILLGGTALPAVAALLAFWPRAGGRVGHPGAALTVLVGLYAVPAIALQFPGEFVRGAVLTVLVLAFLRLERLRFDDAPAAATAATVVAVAAIAAAPLLDRDGPWWDYERWALPTLASTATTFAWEHDYAGIGWPREGTEVLRVRAQQPAYWKAANLDFFDGVTWREGQPFGLQDLGAGAQIPPGGDRRERWTQTIRVSVRDLLSRTFVTAGTTLHVDSPGPSVVTVGGGSYASSRLLRRGDAYRARVYTPPRDPRALAAAGTGYEPWTQWYRALVVRGPEPRPPGPTQSALALIPPFGDDREPLARVRWEEVRPAEPLLRASALRRAWALARELREDAATPYAFVRAVERHFVRGYTYTETPGRRARTLDGFLFDVRAGYCQQFSGAMALLLRLGGVPARVATGFASGIYDKGTREWIVRDLDAHSWVEAWFPGHGWVTFDPTPVDAAVRARGRSDPVQAAGVGDVADIDVGDIPDLEPVISAGEDGPSVPLLLVLGLIGVTGTAGAVRVWRHPPPRGVDELERALRRAGTHVAPGTTLRGLEERLRGDPIAAGYVRALRRERYARDMPAPPSAKERRALRAALSGAGILGRLRGWWALPPRWRSIRRRS